MNIFFLHYIQSICARYHCDKHVVKMILETAQLLCTAIWCSGGEAPYKKTHMNHPSAIWARKSKENWNWLHVLGLELCKEYTYRYGKIHKSQAIIESLKCPNISDIPFTPPPPAMPKMYKSKDSLLSYRLYYIFDKTRMLTWKKRDEPSWIKKTAPF